MTEEFDENNKWHTHANLLFGFICNECDDQFTYDDFPVGDLNERFLEFCVGISAEAKRIGWVCKDDWIFICPTCSSKNK